MCIGTPISPDDLTRDRDFGLFSRILVDVYPSILLHEYVLVEKEWFNLSCRGYILENYHHFVIFTCQFVIISLNAIKLSIQRLLTVLRILSETN